MPNVQVIVKPSAHLTVTVVAEMSVMVPRWTSIVLSPSLV